MSTNYNFRNKSDAERCQSNNGGRIYDNRHSSHEYNDNHFTVSVNSKTIEADYYDETVYWSREEFEIWLKTREWSEENKNIHRGLFTGCLFFDEDGFFDHMPNN